jgi:undecaprenyl diphosphate synthase
VQASKTTNTINYGLKHLAVIMDGNRRWAQSKNLPSFEGHKAGVKALKNLVELCPKYGIKHLTAYTFSTENWNRKKTEVNFLLDLLGTVALSELKNLNEANVKVVFIGNLDRFKGSKLQNILTELESSTANNSQLYLYIALNYGSLDELEHAKQTLIKENKLETINEETFNNYLYTKNVPFPEVVLRTGGEKRLSNFLLWQAAHAELQFIDTLWPDFSEKELLATLTSFSNK